MQTFAIIPAAGRSERMGRPKLLLPWHGSTVIEHVLAAWRASRISRVVIVVRGDDVELAEIAARSGAAVVQPPLAPPEMKDSVRVALDYIRGAYQPAAADAWLLAPADMPDVAPDTINRLIAAHVAELERNSEQTPILIPVRLGKRGHPVLFPWRLADEVYGLKPNEGVNALAERNFTKRIEVETLASEDLDTPADYQRLRRADP